MCAFVPRDLPVPSSRGGNSFPVQTPFSQSLRSARGTPNPVWSSHPRPPDSLGGTGGDRRFLQAKYDDWVLHLMPPSLDLCFYYYY